MDESYGILEYTEENFFNYISYKTKTSYAEVSQKEQILYLAQYLSHHEKEKEKIFFIYENEYVDQHYLNDYSLYYSQSFYPYDKTCARIHFFLTKEDITRNTLREEFIKALDKKDSIVTDADYLGFMVIRPIPNTFLAKVCIKQSSNKTDDNKNKKIIKKSYTVSLFGIDLSISTVAFQEQEKVLSACATTALWSFYHAHPSMQEDRLPSGYMITKSAYGEDSGYDNEFPNKGLSTEMICRSMKKYGLYPRNYYLQVDTSETALKELLYAYNIQDIPAVYGVKVENEDSALHAVVILGYTLDEKDPNIDDKEIPLFAHKIRHIHVHDDRYGAFLQIRLSDNTINIEERKISEIYKPNTLILGIDERIRIDYRKIRQFCQSFREGMLLLLDDETSPVKDICRTLKVTFEKLIWDIKLKKVNDLKRSIVDSMIDDKVTYLTKSWPKYIWSATAKNDKICFELLFDATNIEQGKIFLGILYHGRASTDTIKYDIETFFNVIYPTCPKKDSLFDEVQSFVRDKRLNSNTLVEEFGTLCMPKVIKEAEIVNREILETPLLNICNSQQEISSINELYSEGYDLIWLIDKYGCLRIGKEKKGSNQGHPSLIGGDPARIGGEIKKSGDEWIVNPFSGRYSEEYSPEEKMRYINNVINYKLQPSFPDDTFIVADVKI